MVGTLRFAMCRNVPKRCGFGCFVVLCFGFRIYKVLDTALMGRACLLIVGASGPRGGVRKWARCTAAAARLREHGLWEVLSLPSRLSRGATPFAAQRYIVSMYNDTACAR